MTHSPDVDEAEEALYSLANGVFVQERKIRDNENIITFPEGAELNNLIYVPEPAAADEETLGEILFWFCDEVHEQVFFSPERTPWRTEDRFNSRVRTSNVDQQRVTTVPKQFFGDYIGPHGSKTHRLAEPPAGAAYRLRYGHLYYIIAPPICVEHGMNRGAYLVPVEDVVALKGKATAQMWVEEDITPYLEAVAAASDIEEEPADRDTREETA